jgi:hypothetical protein
MAQLAKAYFLILLYTEAKTSTLPIMPFANYAFAPSRTPLEIAALSFE